MVAPVLVGLIAAAADMTVLKRVDYDPERTIVVTIGLMAWAGVPYYAITNALPVIVVAISVADAIHILSTYYQMREEDPDAGRRDLARIVCGARQSSTATAPSSQLVAPS